MLGWVAVVVAATASQAWAAPIELNMSNLAQPFEGIGALSGGGGVTRLLIGASAHAMHACKPQSSSIHGHASMQRFIMHPLIMCTMHCQPTYHTTA